MMQIIFDLLKKITEFKGKIIFKLLKKNTKIKIDLYKEPLCNSGKIES
jgi:hypothetical protein